MKNILKGLFIFTTVIYLLTGCAGLNSRLVTPENALDSKENMEPNTQDEAVGGKEGITDSGSEESNEEVVDGDAIGEVDPPLNQGITVNFINFELVDMNTLTEELRNNIETLKQSRGYEYWLQADGSYLILISAGEKMNGGYDIKVEAVEDNEGKAIIRVVESEPAKDSMSIQVISYPFALIKASGITDQFVITDQNKNTFSRLTGETVETDIATSDGLDQTNLRIDSSVIDYSKPVVGIYQGQIDNHTIEVLVQDIYMSYSADDIDQYLKGLEVGDKIEITISISPSDQLIVEGISKVE